MVWNNHRKLAEHGYWLFQACRPKFRNYGDGSLIEGLGSVKGVENYKIVFI